ncbi:hypothetical protein ABB37_01392 [Leptomonas pyrrhocoris]|uniref:Leucine-rich repeat protein (LRRP) n=1 Tax=Leptomonas pyrrhocoris TaxID=157538 RepID=A0A0M9G8H4_LEPPY|nr:hypothetical protein ABB37_01392 [Leptomonas pyrrhocoris]KPA84950.1 hypothetical protein ABB37_01392 [Leptomonas pyrrhocoris]|eukprot:XP_015663389.1 hypothetical protein ABB37_01392 [Leptomonas pyrrhocoris]
MLFEPCGDLLKDYGAYCETLRVTEREEVFSAIHTRTVEAPRLAVAGEEGDAASVHTDAEKGRGAAGTDPSPKYKSSRKASRVGGKEGVSGRRKSSLRSSAEAAAMLAGTIAAPQVLHVTLTSIALHYPVFCLNQRDMTPLCRAIPHCPSLLSIELVGCGLSVQSYMKLVEAVYRSPRVITVAVDFNVPFIEYNRQKRYTRLKDTMESGFILDPTLHPPDYSTTAKQDGITGPLLSTELTVDSRTSVSSARSQEQVCNASAHTVPPRSSTTICPTFVAGTRMNSAVAPVSRGRSGSVQKAGNAPRKSSTSLERRQSQASGAEAAAAAGVATSPHRLPVVVDALPGGLPDDDNASTLLYLYPTQYCSLDQQPTPLELQIQEEKEKKGKVDGKKMQQLQAQRELLRAFDQQHRMSVPKAWNGILFTGIHQLSLRGNHIDDATAGRLAQVLLDHQQSRLVSLNLWGNDITDAGAASLARMLRVNNLLQVLDLGHNQLSDTGLLELIGVFLMQQLTSPEDIFAARRAYLTRRGASEEEQKAAGLPLVLADIPSYEDLYAHWWHTQQQTAQLLPPSELSQTQSDGARGGRRKSPRAPALLPTAFPAPPARDTQSSPTAAGNPKRTTPAKNKLTKSESLTGTTAFNTTMMSSSAARAANRHTCSFDKHCVRVRHIADNDAAIRIPGNTVLEVLNLGENKLITVAGAREAARLLRLREPVDAAEMLAMLEVRDPPGLLSGLSSPPTSVSATPDAASKRSQASSHRSGASVATSSTMASDNVSNSGLPTAGVTVIRAPELHCAGLRLRVCDVGSHRESDRAAWSEMDAAQEEVNASLAIWAATPTSA